MDQESLVNGLAVFGALSAAYWVFRILGAIAGWVQRDAIEHERAEQQPKAAAAAKRPQASVAAQADTAPEHDDAASADIAVIAAAVQAMMGANHQVVHIQDTHSGQSWSAEGRWLHQTSHHPH